MSTTALKPFGEMLRDRGRKVPGRIVHHDVQTPEAFDDPIDDATDCLRVAHVTGVDVHLDALVAELDGGSVEDILLATGDGDASTVPTEHADRSPCRSRWRRR